jgi:hypothetical protein
MNSERMIFAQLMDLIPRYEFNLCVKRYSANFTPRKFSYWDQFLSMAFAQLTFRESLRDIEICLGALGTKTYHMGFRSRVTKSTLADANNDRDWRIWADLGKVLITTARKLYANETLEFEFNSAAYALDSTTISLCLKLFPWAKSCSTTSGVKMHTQLDLQGNIPSFALITKEKLNDVNFLDHLIIEAGALYIMDRGYLDYTRLYRFTQQQAFFVTRLKRQNRYRRVKIFSCSKSEAVRWDAAITFPHWRARQHYPERLRLIQYFDATNNRTFIFITNNFLLSAQTIADAYHARWKVELFFKWVKQHLRIKAFFGTSENAVKTQIWIAISVYLLVAILKKRAGLEHSLYSILQVLSISAIDKNPILSAFHEGSLPNSTSLDPNQLNLFKLPTGQ